MWFAFQLSFFRERSRFPSRPGDVQADVVQYLSEQLGITAPDEQDFEYGHVTPRAGTRRQSCGIRVFVAPRIGTGRRCGANWPRCFRGLSGRSGIRSSLVSHEPRAGIFRAVGQDHGAAGPRGLGTMPLKTFFARIADSLVR